jgi:ribonuclease P protein component
VKKRFSKKSRLLKPYQFQRVLRQGKSFAGKYIVAHLFLGSSLNPKLGLTVSKRFGNAAKRCRFKRLVREAFRLSAHHLPSSLEIHVKPRQALSGASMQKIQQELISSLQHVS